MGQIGSKYAKILVDIVLGSWYYRVEPSTSGTSHAAACLNGKYHIIMGGTVMPRAKDALPRDHDELEHYVNAYIKRRDQQPKREELALPANILRIIEAYDALRTIVCRQDGWLRVVPDYDAARLYWKWKYTAGRYDGHYVMYVGDMGDMNSAVVGLLEKIEKADIGELKPTKDKYYGAK